MLLYDAAHRPISVERELARGGEGIVYTLQGQALPAFDRRYQHRAARNLAAALGVLNEGNYIIGDLNESNVLVTPSAMVTLIDVDSFQVQEPRNGRIIVYPPHVGKPEY